MKTLTLIPNTGELDCLVDRLTKQVVTLTLHGHEKFGRALADVRTSDGQDLASWLIGLGLAVPWDGKGPRPVGKQQDDTGEFPVGGQ